MKNKIISETIGWLGAIILLSAYALNSFKIIEGDSLIYQSMNLMGSILIMIYTYYKKAYPNTLLNLIWGIISLAAIIKFLFFK